MRYPLAARAQGGTSFETYSWLFMRVSAIILIVMVLLHFAITHIINDVAAVNYAFVVNRWAGPAWRTFDVIMLTLGLVHGTNGLRIILYDYVRPKGWRVFAQSVLFTLAFALIVVGAIVVFTFTPQPGV